MGDDNYILKKAFHKYIFAFRKEIFGIVFCILKRVFRKCIFTSNGALLSFPISDGCMK